MSVSILLPVYNGDRADHFDEALRSIESQTGCSEAIHIYLGIDGPLSAELESVVRNHLPHIHRIVRHHRNVGPTRNMNSLLSIMDDERFIFRMDADDVSAHDRLAKQIAFMDASPDIAILGSAIEEFDEDSGASRIRTFPTDPDGMPKSLCIACPLAHPAVCIRPEVFEAIGPYPDMRGQDIAMWFEAVRRGYRISNLAEPLLRLRVSRGFLERRSWLGRAWPEFKIYMRGIWRLHGITWRYIYPIARLTLRLAGPRLSGRIYRSDLRNRMAGAGSGRSGSLIDGARGRTSGFPFSVPFLRRSRRSARSRSRNT